MRLDEHGHTRVRSAYRILVGKRGRRDRLKDLCVVERLILEWIVKK
jgi:hypothetical protein